MNEDSEIAACLARMRISMLEAHPENLAESVGSVLGCAVCLEEYQKELENRIKELTKRD